MSSRICVIGAGPCGLTAIKALSEHGFEVDCFEQQDDVGGNWYYGSPHSPMYRSATMISSKRLTEFLDFRMPSDYPQYPSHRQVLAYMQSYAQHFDLIRHIQFDSRVEKVQCVAGDSPNNAWHVHLEGESAPHTYGGVVVASGHHFRPRWPDLGSEFVGASMHSRDYRAPEAFEGKNVLVIGAGNSGCDIAAELGRHAKATWISLRRGYHVMPKFLCGAPLDRCGQTMAKLHLPWFVHRMITAFLLNIAVGPLQRYGLPIPDHRLFEAHPIVNSQLLQEIGHGRVGVKPAIDCIKEDTVEFVDGTCEPIDAIVCATGFELSWPFLDADTFARPGQAIGDQLIMQMFDSRFNGLFFVGLLQPNGGIWGLADRQARLIAKYLQARQTDAAIAARLEQSFTKVRRRDMTAGLQYVDSARHQLEVEYFACQRIMQRLLKRCDRFGLRPTSNPRNETVRQTATVGVTLQDKHPLGSET